MRDALLALVAIVVAYAALDDITTDTDTSFTLEWIAVAVCGVALLAVGWRLARRFKGRPQI